MKWKFENFELDVARFELRCDGRAIHVQPKVWSLLVLLVENNARACTRSELVRTLWPSTRVTESSLRQTLKLARKALGRADMIETVRGLGVRIGVPVSRSAGTEGSLEHEIGP
jgi:DNA-binding winged helix-turn-helix (wHTH) protein